MLLVLSYRTNMKSMDELFVSCSLYIYLSSSLFIGVPQYHLSGFFSDCVKIYCIFSNKFELGVRLMNFKD